jgi:hypothetical protein
MQTVVETPGYLADAKTAGLLEEERRAIVDRLAVQPDAGELIVGTGGARKLRIAGRGKGKSGGYRVISDFAAEDVPVFLLNVFSKGERANLSRAERNTLRVILAELAEAYRKGVSGHVQGR